jgi:ABC-type phosphate transport system auxiliary subunit
MERMMDNNKHERFLAANQELRDFLRRVEDLAKGAGTITDKDLKTLSQRLSTLAPEVGDAARGETLDAGLRTEVAEYVGNLRRLQSALEKVRCIMLARKMELEGAKRHLHGLQGWVNAYSQTT